MSDGGPPVARVVHVRRAVFDVYIGRRFDEFEASPWGNPFKGPGAIERYEAYVRRNPGLLARLPELAGKVLGCWCKPRPCHGDVLVALLEELAARTPGVAPSDTSALHDLVERLREW